MTKTENIEKIRKACIAANPEIMELKLGCKVRYPDEFNHLKDWDGIVLDIWADKWVCVFAPSPETSQTRGVCIRALEDERTNILGREIRLADILLLLKKLNQDQGSLAETFTKMSSKDRYIADGILVILDSWDLKKDNLEEQSGETLLLLANLLPE